MPKTEIALTEIRTDGGTQMRAELREEVCEDYRDLWLAGVEFEEVELFHDGSTYWLADGFHRYFGAQKAKRETIPANVRKGTLRDAILFATKANSDHGLRRSNADKRKAVETLLNDEEWCKWSDRKIAEQAAVSVQFVANIRSELSTVDSSPVARTADEPRVGRDGKTRNQPGVSAEKYEDALARIAQVNGKAAADIRSGTLKATKKRVIEIGALPDSEIGAALKALRNGEAPAETNGKPEPEEKPDAPKVPEKLKPVFEACAQFRDAQTKLKAVQGIVNKLMEAPGGARIQQSAIKADLNNARRHLRFAMPHAVCPYCNARKSNCEGCKGTGWVTEAILKQAPKEMQDAAT